MSTSAGAEIALAPGEFNNLRQLIFELAGISLAEHKKVLITSRLGKRLKRLGVTSYSQYYQLLCEPDQHLERQQLVDLLTTNEIFFFREPSHFEFLSELARTSKSALFRVWSAASSTGEEAYSIAMTLAEARPNGSWEVVGSDISQRVLARARSGHYSLDRTEGITESLLKKYCLRGIGPEQGTLLIGAKLREKVHFVANNLLSPRSDLGLFEVIFLRNVMIYFDPPTKERVVANLRPFLRDSGFLIIGHAESLSGLNTAYTLHQPTLYQGAVRR